MSGREYESLSAGDRRRGYQHSQQCRVPTQPPGHGLPSEEHHGPEPGPAGGVSGRFSFLIKRPFLQKSGNFEKLDFQI